MARAAILSRLMNGLARQLIILFSTFCSLAVGQIMGGDLLIADFEGDDWGAWKVTGEAFGPGPAHGTLPNQMAVDGFLGKGLVNSFHGGDGTTGTLTSPEFKIERKFISFLIGGGKDPEKTCMNLLIDGKAVRNATGPNDKPGGSETLAPEFWDVGEFAGKTAIIQIVDNATGGWGHINVDQIVQTDRKPPQLLADAKREFRIEKRYLNLPIKNGAPKRNVTTLVDGRVEVKNDIELANAAPDWWAFMDVSAWRGKTVTLQVDKLPEDSTALSSIEPSDSIKGAEDLYREPLRGQFHFSSRRGWNNDPNGLVFYSGEYHLFYQHNPYGWGWGNMHWGHAVSRDLVHWRELGDALAPDELGPMFSGSAVVDWNNTSGFGKAGQPRASADLYRGRRSHRQCLASSTDGRHYTKFSGNPVVKQITGGNRDPKVMWHEPTKKWVMALYVEQDGKHTIHFLTSPNLKRLDPHEPHRRLLRVPGLFRTAGGWRRREQEMGAHRRQQRIHGRHVRRHELHAGDAQAAGPPRAGFYAAQTFSDIPQRTAAASKSAGSRPKRQGMPFNQSMTIPLELKLAATPEGPRLTWTPVKELSSLRAKTHRFGAMTLQPDSANPLAA